MAATTYDSPVKPEYLCLLPRYKALQQLRKYLKGEQYDGRPDFFTGLKDGQEVPLRERKPCVIYPMPRGCVEQVVKFTFGEQRFPTIGVSKVDEDDAVAGITVSETDAEFLEGFIDALIENSRLRPGMRRTMRQGLAIGATLAIIKLKAGRFCIELANAEDVYPTFKGGDPSAELESITWCYTFDKTVTGADGKPETKKYWYRQDIDTQAFIEYRQVESRVNEAPIWVVENTTPHNLGFVPARWIRNASSEGETSIDGFSLYGEFLDEFDALNFALSQRHRGINILGVPQPYETGVEEDDGPGATGRIATGYSPSGDKPEHGEVASKPARKSGAGQMWSYRNDKAQVGLIETTGKAFEAATSHVNDVRSRLLESMGVVLVSVSEIMGRTGAGQMSAKFLELAYEPLLALVDEMRCTWWDGALKPLIELMLQWVMKIDGKGLLLPGAEKAAPILAKFYVDTNDGQIWYAPKMVPNWGEYFSAGAEEITQAVAAATAAKDAHLVPEKDAIKAILPYYGREDTNEAIEEIEEDRDAAEERALTAATNEATAYHAAAEGAGVTKPKADRGAGGGKPPSASKS